MDQQDWLKIGAIALAIVGFVAIIGLSISAEDSLEGETWVADELVVDNNATRPLTGTVLTAVFDDGSLSGVAGCNDYFTGYEVDGSSIEMGPIASTQAFCSEPDGIMDQEFAYMGLLEMADRYERDGDRLTLSQGENVLVIYYVARVELLDQ